MKSQTPSTKLQTNLKFQYQMTKTGLEFGILVIVICPSTWLRVVSLSNHLLFDICDLEFLVTPADCRKRGKSIEASSGGDSKPGFQGPDSLQSYGTERYCFAIEAVFKCSVSLPTACWENWQSG
jgi:hypothetical protein